MPKKVIQILLIFFFFSVHHSQMYNRLQINAGSFLVSMDPITGNFGIFESTQPVLDLASILFGGQFPTSHISFNIDGNNYGFQNMHAEYPFATTLNAQIDGIHAIDSLAIETAIFAMSQGESTKNNSIGIVLRITNRAQSKSQTVSAKFKLDTDIGELRNQSLFYLDTGEHVTNSIIMSNGTSNNYFFLGNRKSFQQEVQGEGIYLYPSISTNTPQAVLISSWKNINNTDWIPKTISPNLYDDEGLIDMGIAIFFGPYTLYPEEFVDFGIVLSKAQTYVKPLLDQQVISEGVLSEDRFDFSFEPYSAVDQFFNPQSRRASPKQQQISPRKELEQSIENVPSLLSGDEIWKYLFKMNTEMKSVEDGINKQLKRSE